MSQIKCGKKQWGMISVVWYEKQKAKEIYERNKRVINWGYIPLTLLLIFSIYKQADYISSTIMKEPVEIAIHSREKSQRYCKIQYLCPPKYEIFYEWSYNNQIEQGVTTVTEGLYLKQKINDEDDTAIFYKSTMGNVYFPVSTLESFLDAWRVLIVMAFWVWFKYLRRVAKAPPQ